LEDMTLGWAVDFLGTANKAGNSLTADFATKIQDDLVPSLGLDVVKGTFDVIKGGGATSGKAQEVFEKNKDAFKSRMAEIVVRDLLEPGDLTELHINLERQEDKMELEQACIGFIEHCTQKDVFLKDHKVSGGETAFGPATVRGNLIKQKLMDKLSEKVKKPQFSASIIESLKYAIGNDTENEKGVREILIPACESGQLTAPEAFQLLYLMESGKMSQDGGNFAAMLRACSIIKRLDDGLGTRLFANVFYKLAWLSAKVAGKEVKNALINSSEDDIPPGLNTEFRNVLSYYRDAAKDKIQGIGDATLGYFPYIAGGGAIGVGGIVGLNWAANAKMRANLNKVMPGLGDRMVPGGVRGATRSIPFFGQNVIRPIDELFFRKSVPGNGWDQLDEIGKVLKANEIAKVLEASGFRNADHLARALQQSGANADDIARALYRAGHEVDDVHVPWKG
jgi:hypothetical protein